MLQVGLLVSLTTCDMKLALILGALVAVSHITTCQCQWGGEFLHQAGASALTISTGVWPFVHSVGASVAGFFLLITSSEIFV